MLQKKTVKKEARMISRTVLLSLVLLGILALFAYRLFSPDKKDPPATIAVSQVITEPRELVPVAAVLDGPDFSSTSETAHVSVDSSNTTEIGSIDGVVVDLNGALLNATVVQLATYSEKPNMNPHISARATTNERGQFRLDNIAAGQYLIDIIPSQYISLNNYSQSYSLELTAGERKSGLRLVFGDENSRTLWGVVLDPDGLPVPDAFVDCQNWGNVGFSMQVRTSEDGTYHVEGLPEGEYQVTLSAWARDFTPGDATHRTVMPDTEQNFILYPQPTIEGQVLNAATGQPIERFAIEAVATPDNLAEEDEWKHMIRPSTIISDAEGRFSVSAKEFGSITIWVKADGFELAREHVACVEVGKNAKDVIVRVSGGIVVVGKVVDSSGKPIEGAIVASGIASQLGSGNGVSSSSVKSDSEGHFKLEGVPQDASVISATFPGYAIGTSPLNIPSSGTSNITIVLGRGGSIEGIVTLDGDVVSHDSPADYYVVARLPDGKSGQKEAQVLDDGTYLLSGLMPGETSIHCYLSGFFPGGSTERWGEVSTVVLEEQSTTVNFTFNSGSAAIEGTVSSANIPIATGRIRIWTDDSAEMRCYFEASIEDGGRFRIEQVPAGKFQGSVLVSDHAGVYPDHLFDIEASDGETTLCNIELK